MLLIKWPFVSNYAKKDWLDGVKKLILTYEGNLDILIVLRGDLMLHYFLTDCKDHRLVTVRLFYVVIDDFVQKACLSDTWTA